MLDSAVSLILLIVQSEMCELRYEVLQFEEPISWNHLAIYADMKDNRLNVERLMILTLENDSADVSPETTK